MTELTKLQTNKNEREFETRRDMSFTYLIQLTGQGSITIT